MSEIEFQETFKEEYKKVKKLGFENYFISGRNGVLITWKDINDMIDNKIKIPEEEKKVIFENIRLLSKERQILKKFIGTTNKLKGDKDE